ncbi:DUF5134 domain-containing protein [Microlunatus sp. Gsoil 973]|uniref:DUF5134 domain-containing protein n=1 Tax=Microlunatus sp. Gsoil 973 TaxID=2672569 RepID=UPI0012B45901|nr:DUF5134 domain-containing protein [Microlunatus sp. Gsoil 973]QGN32177.1 DUF5134 domain-containing protein [Microlunatus sp. Gsoil 973]
MMTYVGPLVIVLFAATGGYYLVRVVRDRNRNDRVVDGSHLLMSILMIMMPLGWSVRVPAGVQILLFTAAALWYAYLFLFRPRAIFETIDSHHSGRPRLAYHSVMMLAMVWMAVIMAPLPGAGRAAAATAGGSGSAVSAASRMQMPGMGMTMSGTTTSPKSPAGAIGPSAPSAHPWADPVSIMIGIGFVAATLWYVIGFVRIGAAAGAVDRRRLADTGVAALMAAGMALSNLAVIV